MNEYISYENDYFCVICSSLIFHLNFRHRFKARKCLTMSFMRARTHAQSMHTYWQTSDQTGNFVIKIQFEELQRWLIFICQPGKHTNLKYINKYNVLYVIRMKIALTSFLHKRKQIVQEILTLRIIIDFVQLKWNWSKKQKQTHYSFIQYKYK